MLGRRGKVELKCCAVNYRADLKVRSLGPTPRQLIAVRSDPAVHAAPARKPPANLPQSTASLDRARARQCCACLGSAGVKQRADRTLPKNREGVPFHALLIQLHVTVSMMTAVYGSSRTRGCGRPDCGCSQERRSLSKERLYRSLRQGARIVGDWLACPTNHTPCDEHDGSMAYRLASGALSIPGPNSRVLVVGCKEARFEM